MMRKLVFFIIILSLVGPILGQTSYDVEYAQVCLIDSIAPDTVIQFWRFTQANNPGEYSVDVTFDMGSSYTVAGTVLPCCSCLTEATAMSGAGGGGGIGDIAQSNPAPINALLVLSGAVLLVLIIPRRKIAVMLILAAPAAVSAQPGTTYDIEHTCICLVDSIAADTVIQFWRFTQSNNPGEYSVDVTFDMGSSYTVAGTVLSCKDYYLGDNPGGSGTANTLTMWAGTSSLGNSSVTQSGQILSTSLTGAFKLPIHTTAGRPVGVSGYLANNSTENGIEGYNGGNWYFLPWSDADNWTSGYVPFSDGSKLTASNQIIFSSNELRIGNAADMGGYILQVAGGSKYTSRGEFAGSQTLSNMLTVQNTYSGTSYAIDATGYSAGVVASATNTETSIYAAQSGSISTNTVAISINNRDSPVGSSDKIMNLGGSRQIYWQYGRQNAGASPAYNYSAAFIRPIVADNHYGNQDVSLEFGISKQNASTKVMALDSAGLLLPLYAAGTLTGTTAYFAAFTSSGRIIEKTPANVISDLGIGNGSISTSTDGSGDIAVTHGMGTTPAQVIITVTGTTPYFVTVTAKGATTFTVRFFAAVTGLAVPTTAVTFDWLAKT